MTDTRFQLDTRSKTLVRRLLREYLRPYRWAFVLAFVCMALAAASMAGIALMVGWMMDEIVDGQRHDLIYVAAGLVFAVFMVRGVAALGQHLSINWAGQRIVADIQSQFYRHMMYADLAFFHNNPTGEMISRLTHDVWRLRFAVSDALTSFGLHLFTAVALIAVMFAKDWLLALIAFVTMPLAVVPVYLIGRRQRRLSAETQAEAARFATRLEETFRGVRHVKAYGREEYEIERSDGVIERLFRVFFRMFKTEAVAHPVVDFLAGTAIFLVMLYGAFMVIEGAHSKGDFIAFITAVLLAYSPIKQLSILNARIQEGLGAAQRIFDALDVEPSIVDRPGAKPLEVKRGGLRLDGVSFAYGGGVPALQDVSLEVPAGKTIALVGPSGAGKSTIMNLIPRFYDVDAGSVTIDDQDVREVTLASLRQNIGLVSQEISLFDDSIRTNIAYGRPDATEDEIVAAAKRAAAHEFIVKLPDGYDTQVGGDGVRLSGGQRQRVAIARAMLKSAPILLLDEATSALDTESERKVQAALQALMVGRTTLVIAHRLSTVFDADMIYVIESGRLVEQGTHAALVDNGGIYARLYSLQLAGSDGPESLGAGNA